MVETAVTLLHVNAVAVLCVCLCAILLDILSINGTQLPLQSLPKPPYFLLSVRPFPIVRIISECYRAHNGEWRQSGVGRVERVYLVCVPDGHVWCCLSSASVPPSPGLGDWHRISHLLIIASACSLPPLP